MLHKIRLHADSGEKKGKVNRMIWYVAENTMLSSRLPIYPHDQAVKCALKPMTVKAIVNGIGIEERFRIEDAGQLEEENPEVILQVNRHPFFLSFQRVFVDVLYSLMSSPRRVYYLIENKSNVDYATGDQVAYQGACIRNAHRERQRVIHSMIREKAKNEGVKAILEKCTPIIIPVILYTGKARWTAETCRRKQEGQDLGKYYCVDYNIPVIDIRHMDEAELPAYGPDVELAFRMIRAGDDSHALKNLIVQNHDRLMYMDLGLLGMAIEEITLKEDAFAAFQETVRNNEEDNRRIMKAFDRIVEEEGVRAAIRMQNLILSKQVSDGLITPEQEMMYRQWVQEELGQDLQKMEEELKQVPAWPSGMA